MEQNINDVLKLLKDYANTQQEDSENTVQERKSEDISNEDLHERLKNTYIDGSLQNNFDGDVSQNEYSIDENFFSETDENSTVERISEIEAYSDGVNNVTDNEVDESKNSVVYEEQAVVENILETDTSEEAAVSEYAELSEEASICDDENICEAAHIADELDDSGTEVPFAETVKAENNDNNELGELPEDNTEELVAALKPTEAEPAYSDENDEYADDLAELDEQEQIYADVSNADDEMGTDYTDNGKEADEQIIEIAAVDTVKPDEAEQPHETFLASMRKTGIDFTTEDIYNSSAQRNAEQNSQENFELQTDTPISETEDIDLSTVNLMMQFCDKQELEETIGDARVDDFLKYEDLSVEKDSRTKATDGKEYSDFEQNDSIFAAYKKKKKHTLWLAAGCIFIAIVAFIYELMPLVGANTNGAFDYVAYPSVYALIGLQLLVFAAAICHKQLWDGLKRAFSMTPNTYSIVGIILIMTATHDVILAIILAFTKDELPPTFNAVAAFVCALCILADYFDVCAESNAFKVYSSDAKKYTLVREDKNGSIGSKMYGGGLESDKTVYSVHCVDFPNGFFRSLQRTPQKNKMLTVLLIPVFIAAVLAAIVSAIIGADAYSAAAAFMICIYAVLPTVMILTDVLPYAAACIKLAKRGSAFAGRGAIDKYEKCDVVVFNDLHLFKKCKTEDVGIAIYDTGVGYLTLGCLDALYSKIGGPLSGMQINLPDVFKFHNVAFKRVTRNGIEAVIENKHTIIVGEPSFMQRYGLNFPENEQENGRLTLCVSLDGKVTSKISVCYETEPVFEMLAERLYAEGISCAIQTCDPLIGSAVIARARKLGEAPISVIHKNTEDFKAEKGKRYRGDEDGVISCSSRLKLAEVEVWIKRLSKIKKQSLRTVMGFSAFGALALILLIAFGAEKYVNQWHVLLYLLVELAAVCIPIFFTLPSKKYFTVDALYASLEQEHKKRSDVSVVKNKKQISKEI